MAGTEVGQLYYDLTINDKKLHAGLDAADSKVKKFGDGIEKIAKVAATSFAVIGAAGIAFGIASVKAFNESQQSIAQLEAVLKSTSGAAGVTKQAAIDLSKQIQKNTSISDEAALAVENMGLTFTAIGKDIFPQATMAAIDMATALNHGMKPSAEQSADAMKLIGKALQDPDAGLGALHRVGVNVDELAKKFVGVTDKATKQKLILQELGTEFGGSAAAQAKTFAGQLDQIKNNMNDVQESIGLAIVKAITPLTNKLADFVKRVDWEAVINRSIKAISNLWQNYLVPFAKAVADVATQVGDYLGPKFEALWHTINEQIIPILSDLWHNVIEPLAPVLGTIFVAAIGAIIDAINILLRGLGWLYQAFKDGNPVILGLAGVFGTLAAAMAFNAVFNALTVGFATLRLITIPQTMASIQALRALIMTPTVFGAIAVGAAVASIMLVYNAAQKTLAALDDLAATENANAQSDAEVTKRWQAMIKKGRATGNQDMVNKGIAGLKHMQELDARARATGGPVNRGMPYLVGERGPELFIPSTSGQVISNEKTMGRHSQVNINIGSIQDRQDADYLMRRMDRALNLEGLGLTGA